MILLAAVLVSVVIALLRGGRLENLARLPLRWGGLIILAFLAQTYFIYGSPASARSGGSGVQEAVLIGSALLVLLVIWLNRRLPGIAVIGLGLLLNVAVMVANGGLMPITPQAIQAVGHEGRVTATEPGAKLGYSKDVVLSRAETRLWLLSDIFVLPRPFPIPSVFSLGDMLIAIGAFITIQHGLLAPPAAST